ncbi:polysaccharide deacetylase family protein [Croceibacterium aestuarii]|uniref:polysaccharide deacetylase family protein n=1 Tax=Croceibacterium aestuarii TaxID=3064139 RepID=UPI00272E32F7|nr:polysaccharide deacetylase family protein [Croceibacterium sp. D39]
MHAITDPPSPGSHARFDAQFGRRFILTVDTEEEFDWSKPLAREGHTLDHLTRLAKFQTFCEALDVVPIYLVDWPIATSKLAAEILRPSVLAGKAEVGVQLHPWVNPPYDEEVTPANSFAGNLPRELEAAKLGNLRDRIEQAFGTAPLIYRAGRYGTGPNTAQILSDEGIAIDTSVRANFDYSAGAGPDYSRHPLSPYWLDGERTLLELPLTTVYWGMLRRQGRALYPLSQRVPHLPGVLSRLGLLERISLTPEGVGIDEAIRAIDIAVDDGLPLLVFSFHSPSLQPGHTPYVRSDRDLDALYGWFREAFAYCERCGVAPTSVGGIMQSVMR